MLFLAFLGGCATYDAKIGRDLSLDGVQRFFVVGNPNDNRAINHQITAALRSRGYVAETGPLTMMPDDTQAIITYQDHWTWDFGDRLVYLQLTVRDQKTGRTYATVAYSTRMPSGQSLNVIADGLVGRIVAGEKQ